MVWFVVEKCLCGLDQCKMGTKWNFLFFSGSFLGGGLLICTSREIPRVGKCLPEISSSFLAIVQVNLEGTGLYPLLRG
jgi:hypothetical protein